MFTITDKVINKIITNRMKLLIPQLMDKQHMGFVHDRNITDNPLALCLVKEFAKASK